MARCRSIFCSSEVDRWGDYCPKHAHLDPEVKAKNGELGETDCSYNKNIICPHCGHEMEDDDHSVEEGGYHEWECGKCDELFYVTMDIDITYTTSKSQDGTWEEDAEEAPAHEK